MNTNYDLPIELNIVQFILITSDCNTINKTEFGAFFIIIINIILFRQAKYQAK